MRTNSTLSSPPTPTLRRYWWLALALFVLAGSTGAWMRFGITAGFPWGLQFSNIRHAHSHLMYFGWATPALIALMMAYLPMVTKRPYPRPIHPILTYILTAGLLAYVPFLLFGYSSTTIGSLSLPLSVIAAGLNVLGWYAFALLYWRYTKNAVRHFPLQIWDTAVIFMLLASLGGWGLPLLTLLNVQNPLLSMAFTHLFLDTFADGWFVLATLGLIYAVHPPAARQPAAQRSHLLLTVGLPVLFLLGIPTHLLTLPLRLIGSLGGLLVGLGLAGHLWVLWPHVRAQTRGWLIPLFFLGLKAVTQLALLLPPVAEWALVAGLRISYLHWLLLGFVSLGIVQAAAWRWPTAVSGTRWFTLAILLLVMTLLPLTQLWPAAWRGQWVLTAAAWGALAPVLAAVGMLATAVYRRYQPI